MTRRRAGGRESSGDSGADVVIVRSELLFMDEEERCVLC